MHVKENWSLIVKSFIYNFRMTHVKENWNLIVKSHFKRQTFYLLVKTHKYEETEQNCADWLILTCFI